MKQLLLLTTALLISQSPACALTPQKKYMRRSSTAGLSRALLARSGGYLTTLRAQWKKQPVRVAGGYKRCTPFTVLSTSADVRKSGSVSAPYVGNLIIKVIYRETAVYRTPTQAMRAPLKTSREFAFEPSYSYHVGKWIPAMME